MGYQVRRKTPEIINLNESEHRETPRGKEIIVSEGFLKVSQSECPSAERSLL